ncbi:MAG: hypothetical protein LUQ65_14340 [Candidatus Helarchaeota archaeon]|nr:hypothetical protein [Candidatus Helarchaeota archaeon]
MSEPVSKSKERVLRRIEDRKKMQSTVIICFAVAIISILVLVLIRAGIIDLQSTLGSVSFIFPGLIRVLLLIVFFATMIIGIANLREYYVVQISSWFDIISLLIITVLVAYFMFDFPFGIADTLSTLGGCLLIVVYLYLVQD